MLDPVDPTGLNEPTAHPQQEAPPTPSAQDDSDATGGEAPLVHSGDRLHAASLISPHKSAFMSLPVKNPDRLPVEAYRQLAIDYRAKHGIDIRFNGGEDNPVLQREQSRWLEDRRNELNGERAYGAVAEDVFSLLGDDEKTAYMNDVGRFLYARPRGAVKDQHLVDFISTIRASPRWKSVFDRNVEDSVSRLPREAQKVGLSMAGAAQTIRHLMAQAEDGPIAFLRASALGQVKGISAGNGHITSAIITPGLVIGTAADQPDMDIADSDDDSIRYSEPNLSRLILGVEKKISPQADTVSCGSLAISQLKELLKNEADQLHHECLIISDIDRKNYAEADPTALFLLSPGALRYSQSTLLIKVARAVVAGSAPEVDIQHKGQTYRVKTLMGLQLQGANLTMVDGRTADLDKFRDRWLKRLDQEVIPARNAMQLGTGGQARNQYLAYLVHRHFSRFNAA